MTAWRIIAAMISIAACTLATAQDHPFDDPALEARYQTFIREVRCPKCQNESIAESDAPVANDLKREIREQMEAGATEQDVAEFLLARYGDFVLYRPRVTPMNYALWAGPFLFIGIGAFAFWRMLQARAQQPIEEDEA